MKKVYNLLIILSFSTFIGCALLDESKKPQAFPKKKMAKKTQTKQKQSWKEIKNQTNKPFLERINNIEKFISENKDKSIALSAYLLKAKIFLQNNKYKQACSTYHKVVESVFDYPDSWPAYRDSAKCHFKAKKTLLALQTLERFIQKPKAHFTDKRKGALLQWDFLKNKQTFKKWKLISLSHLAVLSAHNKEKWKNRGKNLIQNLTHKELITYTNTTESFNIFKGYLYYKAGKYFFSNKDFTQAKNYLKNALSSSLSDHLKKEVKQNLLMIKKISKVNPYLIGVLLPLSGRKKALGEKILRGLYLGLDMEKDSSWQMIVMNSQSHPDVVKTHLDSLFYKYHVIGFIGGLTSETAEVIAQKAEEFATPAILFSQKKNLSLHRNFVFQNALTAKQLLNPLIQHIRESLKVQKASLLYPEDPYGKEYSALFSKIFKQGGGEIAGEEMYKAGETDFKKHITKLLHLNIKGREKEFEKLKDQFLKENPSLSGRSKKLTAENILPAKKEFSALFIPDTLDRLQKIQDHLRYFGIKNVFLLGTNIWPVKQTQSKNFTLVFVNLPQKDPLLIKKSSFHKNFISSYGYSPGNFEQRAYNTALFLKQALGQKVKSRILLQEKLKQIRSFQGAYYTILLSEDQVFQYPLNVYEKGLDQIR